jgi:hypothetical protein
MQRHPRAVRSRAVAAPIPLDPPVTTATFMRARNSRLPAL